MNKKAKELVKSILILIGASFVLIKVISIAVDMMLQ